MSDQPNPSEEAPELTQGFTPSDLDEIENEHEQAVFGPFQFRDSALVTLATGVSALNLREFRDAVSRIPDSSLYHHFWGRLLQSRFDEPEYNNDFAAWAYWGMHDKPLAEMLAVIDPTDFDEMADLRREVIETVETRMDESELAPWRQADQAFYFVRSQLVVMSADLVITEAHQLADVVGQLSHGSVFYHFIDARNRTDDRIDDFSSWLLGFGARYEDLVQSILAIDPYFSSLKKLRLDLANLFETYFEELNNG